MPVRINGLPRPRPIKAAALGLIAIILASLFAIAPASANAAGTTYEFRPVRLVVHNIEDWWPDQYDEPRMYYGGQVWADVVRERSTVEGYRLPRATFTGTQMKVDLWERDNGWTDNNHLGSAYVPATPDQEQSLWFGSPSGPYFYELIYNVVAVS